MFSIPPAHDLPRCAGRLAKSMVPFSMLLAGILLGPATASSQLVAATPDSQHAGPACRLQQRQASELRIVSAISEFDWQPVLHAAATCRESLAQFHLAAHQHQRIAMQQTPEEQARIEEEIAPGTPKNDPCFVSLPLSSVSVNIDAPSGEFPENIAAICRESTEPVGDDRLVCGWSMYEKHWAATGMYHRPLYFEEVNAERYGYTCGPCLQPFVSAGRFLVTIPALPYLMCARPPHECVYTLGHYRPGDCVPYRWHLPRCRVTAGAFEAAVIVGLVALIP